MQTSVPQRVLAYIRRHPMVRAGERVGVAVSGGPDSVALARLLLELRPELGVVLSLVHLNHKLRGAEAEADERFVSLLAREHGLELHAEAADVRRYARERRLGLEAAGRELRYRFFERLMRQGVVSRVATGHTLDDQAETVLLRFLRGAGTRGLAGIYPVRNTGSGAIIRPLLEVRRDELVEYLRALGQEWREDASNRDLGPARNRIRHEVLPLLEREQPGLQQVLAGMAETARAEEEYWALEVERRLPQVAPAAGAIRLKLLAQQPPALQRRLLRAVAEGLGLRLDAQHVGQLLALAFPQEPRRGRVLQLPGGWRARCAGGELWLERATIPKARIPKGG